MCERRSRTVCRVAFAACLDALALFNHQLSATLCTCFLQAVLEHCRPPSASGSITNSKSALMRMSCECLLPCRSDELEKLWSKAAAQLEALYNKADKQQASSQ